MRTLRKFAPLDASHQLVADGELCPACKRTFVVEDVVTLIPLGPGDSEEARAAARAGESYCAVAAPVHWACATGERP